jgi:hypothetical protein
MRERESLRQLKKYPMFRGWRAKAEAHEEELVPMEAADLKKKGTFDKIIDSRTLSFWECPDRREGEGSNQQEAEEMALPN